MCAGLNGTSGSYPFVPILRDHKERWGGLQEPEVVDYYKETVFPGHSTEVVYMNL